MMNSIACRYAALLTVAIALVNQARAQHPANPSFSLAVDTDVLTHNFGTFRQGASGAELNFSVFNFPAPSGTTAALTLSNTNSLGDTASIILNTGSVVSLPPGSGSPMSLMLDTTIAGSHSVSYTLQFSSDGMPGEPLKNLAIAGFANVYRRGDYDLDHDVDNADFNLWRSTLGTNTSATDGNENGITDAADYVVWRENFTGPGPFGAGGGLASTAVPEPATATIALGMACLALLRRRKRNRRASI